MAEFKGVNPRWTSIDEAGEFDGRHPSEQAKRRGLGDNWDMTPSGVVMPPMPLGALVEAWDELTETLLVGTVVDRGRLNSAANATIYTVETGGREIKVSRHHLTVFDKSPDGIERFLEGPRTREEMARPKTAEEIERWLDA